MNHVTNALTMTSIPKMKMSNMKVLLVVAVAATLQACATTPPINPQLEQARSAVSRAQSSPDVSKYAPLDLDEAQKLLARADEALTAKEKPEVVTHLAYLANQKAATAEQRAHEKALNETISQAGRDRDQLQLQARTHEANSANSRADQAESRASALAQELSDMQAKKTDRGMVLTLGDVLFDTGRAELKSGALSTLDKLADFMKQNTERTIQVEGFTDSVGSDDYNMDLSQRRADTVREAVLSRGIAAERVKARGYGKQYSVASNGNAAGRQLNRRVEIVISDETGQIRPRN